MKITEFNRTNLKSLRNEMQAVLDKYGAQTNIDIEVGNMSFSDAEVSIKVKAKVVGGVTIDDRILDDQINGLNLVKTNSKGDTLTGFSTRSSKYPFKYTCGLTGKKFKCDRPTAINKFSQFSMNS